MDIFLTKIHINKIFHLEDIDIEIDPNVKKHLIITGASGCGKTSLLNALVDFLQKAQDDVNQGFLDYENLLEIRERALKELLLNPTNDHMIANAKNLVDVSKGLISKMFGKVRPELSNIKELSKKVRDSEFILAFYEANRKTSMAVPKTPDKPNLNKNNNIKIGKQKEFLKFLIDLKIQEALARNENDLDGANKIKDWFDGFTDLLNEIFEGEEKLNLDFNYKDYSFKINQRNKSFGFNELSDGYSAIIDIVVDLVLKMQQTNNLVRAYEMHGIVFIDEIETHLHLKLQKVILPMLTRVFPNIQFVVTTHSPFVLSSLNDAVAYDLEKRERLEDLTEYSYEALAEGYFKVNPASSYLQTKLDRYKELANQEVLDNAESLELKNLEEEFDNLNEIVSPPSVKGEYLQIKLKKKTT